MCKFQFKLVKKSPFIQYNTDNIANNVNFTNYVLKLNKDITRLIRKQLKNTILFRIFGLNCKRVSFAGFHKNRA